MSCRILITGGSGLLALNWALAMRGKFEIFLGLHKRNIFVTGVSTAKFSLQSVDSIVTYLTSVNPQFVVHTAGITSVEVCEQDQILAYNVNVQMSQNVAIACAKLKIPLVHISTDHLFSGKKPWTDETAPTSPINVYGMTKATAELRVLEAFPDALVIRTNFYGWGTSYRKSFSDLIINSLRVGKSLQLFHDVFYTPIIISELARVAHELVGRGSRGIYNVVGDDRLSKYDFGVAVANEFALDSSLIEPCSIVKRTDLVARPFDMSLSNVKVRNLLGRRLGGVEEQLIELRRQDHVGLAKLLQIV